MQEKTESTMEVENIHPVLTIDEKESIEQKIAYTLLQILGDE